VLFWETIYLIVAKGCYTMDEGQIEENKMLFQIHLNYCRSSFSYVRVRGVKLSPFFHSYLISIFLNFFMACSDIDECIFNFYAENIFVRHLESPYLVFPYEYITFSMHPSKCIFSRINRLHSACKVAWQWEFSPSTQLYLEEYSFVQLQSCKKAHNSQHSKKKKNVPISITESLKST